MAADLKTLKIDDRWSVKYDPNNNDRPTELLRYNESVGSVAHWNNPQVAMFYALLEKSQPAPAEAQTNFAAMIVGCNGLSCQDGQILIDFGDEGDAAQAYDVLCAEVDVTSNFKPSVLIDTRTKLLDQFKCILTTDEIIEDGASVYDLGGDSLDEIKLLMGAEESFDIVLDDAEWEKCLTFGDYLALIEKTLAG